MFLGDCPFLFIWGGGYRYVLSILHLVISMKLDIVLKDMNLPYNTFKAQLKTHLFDSTAN